MTGKTRVLVVDDEPAILRFLRPALEANSYEIETAGTVADATKLIASKSPDVVVLDLGLPDGDGKDVIRRVREPSVTSNAAAESAHTASTPEASICAASARNEDFTCSRSR